MSDEEEVTRVTPEGRTGRFLRELEAAQTANRELAASLLAARIRERRLLLGTWLLFGLIAIDSAVIVALACW